MVARSSPKARRWLCRTIFFVLYTLFVSFLVSFAYVLSHLDDIDTAIPSTAGAEHSPARVLSTAPENVQYVDRGARNGGRRPTVPSDFRLASLTCDGLEASESQEMVYWQNIPEDNAYTSPFYREGTDRQYLTFAMDEGGFNNIRMAYETVLAMSHAMGRTIVLPPEQEVYLLYSTDQGKQRIFGFRDFFPIDNIAANTAGLDIITTEEFLIREALSGNLRDKATGAKSFPPKNRTNWDGDEEAVIHELQPWLETVAFVPSWDPEECIAAFPSTPGHVPSEAFKLMVQEEFDRGAFPSYEAFIGNPTPVYANATLRLAESLNGRENVCVYNEEDEKLVHFHGNRERGGRLLVHFYAFLFFENWQEDLWTKRFIRDKVRYNDEIQCAAGRIVAAIRQLAADGEFDAFHVRRGEFQYKRTRVSAQDMYDISSEQIPDNSTVYIATDERNKGFFRDLAKRYNVLFLDDFQDLLAGLDANYYGMVDQLIASRSRTYFGCWFST